MSQHLTTPKHLNMQKWDTPYFSVFFSKTSVLKVSPPSLSHCPCLGFHLIPFKPHFQIFFQRKCTCVCISTHYCCANTWSWFIKLSRGVFHCGLHLMAFTFVSRTNSVSVAVSTKPSCCFCLPYLCAVWFPVERKEEGVAAFRK